MNVRFVQLVHISHTMERLISVVDGVTSGVLVQRTTTKSMSLPSKKHTNKASDKMWKFNSQKYLHRAHLSLCLR